VKEIRSFLGHAGFYRRFIKDFSKIARPLCKLLAKETPFEFDEECLKAFGALKEILTSTPVIRPPVGVNLLRSCVTHQTMQLELFWGSILRNFPM
jgi:hypothetical protein